MNDDGSRERVSCRRKMPASPLSQVSEVTAAQETPASEALLRWRRFFLRGLIMNDAVTFLCLARYARPGLSLSWPREN